MLSELAKGSVLHFCNFQCLIAEKVADFRELLKTVLCNEDFLPDLHDIMNLECVKENHLISKLAFSHFNDRYDLIKAGFQIDAR